MKKFILLLLLLIPFISSAQLTTINPDTVCYQTAGSTYQVPSLGAGYTYTWAVAAPGIITAGQGTNGITVDWSAAAPGLIPNGVSVFATNATGCQSTPVNLNVFILNVIPVITPIGPFCQSEACANLTANVAGGTWSGPGVNGSQFCPQTAGAGNHVITYTYTLAGCTFVATTIIIVEISPVLSPIQHD
jgi:hypothetical protein